MKKLFVCFALLACIGAGSTPSFANDSAITGVSGTPGNMKVVQLAGEHRSIRMVRETVAITVFQTDYVTDARFEFHNDGAATTVKMGFPESGSGDVDGREWRKQTSFKSFRTWVDGRETKARRLLASGQGAGFEAFWIKTVAFKRGQTRHVRVLYRSSIGGSGYGDFVSYDFTGGNWKGRVAQSDLSVQLTAPGRYIVGAYYGETPRPKEWRKGNTFHFRWRNWQAQTGFSLRYLAELPGTMTLAETPQELKKVSDNALGAKKVDLLIIASPNKKFDPNNGPSFVPAAFLLRDHRTFVSVRDFYEILMYEHGVGPSTKPWSGTFAWNEKTRSVRFTTGGDKPKIIRIAENSHSFEIDGKKFSLPASTFINGHGDRRTLYAPLAPLVAALKGKLQVNTRTHRVWYEIPA